MRWPASVSYDVERAAKERDDSIHLACGASDPPLCWTVSAPGGGEQSVRVLPESPTGQVIGYARSNWAALNHFLEAGSPQIDNNAGQSIFFL